MMAHRLRAARGQLVLQHPFLGALLLRLSMRPYERCRSIATMARKFTIIPHSLKTCLSVTFSCESREPLNEHAWSSPYRQSFGLPSLMTMAPKIVSESEMQGDQRHSDGPANDDIAEQWQSNVTHRPATRRSRALAAARRARSSGPGPRPRRRPAARPRSIRAPPCRCDNG